MNEIKTEILIDAPKERIWDILCDFHAYPNWNPFIVKISGKAKLGARILFAARMSGIKLHIVARIRAFEKNRCLSWGGPASPWIKRIVGAEHYLIIEELKPGHCRVIHGERMFGLLPNFAWPMIKRSRPAYIAMNQALKALAEQHGRIQSMF